MLMMITMTEVSRATGTSANSASVGEPAGSFFGAKWGGVENWISFGKKFVGVFG